MINESFPAIEFHDFYIHYLLYNIINSSTNLVLSMSVLLSTVNMFVQHSKVHILSGICDQCVTVEISDAHKDDHKVMIKVIPTTSSGAPDNIERYQIGTINQLNSIF